MPDPKDKKTFSANEVMALMEDLKSDFRNVAEIVAPLPERLDRVESRLEKVENRLTTLEDAVRITLPTVNKRLNTLEAKVGV